MPMPASKPIAKEAIVCGCSRSHSLADVKVIAMSESPVLFSAAIVAPARFGGKEVWEL